MTDIHASPAAFSQKVSRNSGFAVEDAFWGYKIRSGQTVPLSVLLGQALSFFFGVCFLTACIGILVLPTLFFDGGLGVVRLGAVVLLGAAAAYLLWFASRGTLAEVHVDTSTGEIQEVICNRAGKPTAVGFYDFKEISGVFLVSNSETGLWELLMRHSPSLPPILVAEGTEAQLIPLRDRLARDLLDLPKSRSEKAA
ncbi:MAG: hypothetical protein NWQ23_13455 [Yoonia sp.]|uniref:hypothetical protein n=1 Tax=Yoonia sp. TaxID=2212373 RepID=UPI00273F7659|nr:hypothetical protein [Yoonia sp.]MDP5086422.1 hypothetical protein [Yoonia sp.]